MQLSKSVGDTLVVLMILAGNGQKIDQKLHQTNRPVSWLFFTCAGILVHYRKRVVSCMHLITTEINSKFSLTTVQYVLISPFARTEFVQRV